jgi:hypothetical protein
MKPRESSQKEWTRTLVPSVILVSAGEVKEKEKQ